MHLIGCRTALSELLLRPCPILNEIVGGIIAKYSTIYNIEIFALCVLGNHYHMLVRAPEASLPLFVENMNREIALRVNRYLGRSGHFWSRRYDDLIVLEGADVLEALLYIVTNSVKHGLVRHPNSWPGICSYRQAIGFKEKTYRFCNFTEYHKARRLAARSGEYVCRSDFEEQYVLKIKPLSDLPELAKMTVSGVERLINQRTSKLVSQRISTGEGFLGRRRVLAQPAQGVFPKKTNKTNRPSCYSKNVVATLDYRETERKRRANYRDCSFLFRLGNFNILFPKFTILPPLHHTPKLHPT